MTRGTREILIGYLKMKVDAEDWHGVADAAMDLRDYDEFMRGFERGQVVANDKRDLARDGAL